MMQRMQKQQLLQGKRSKKAMCRGENTVLHTVLHIETLSKGKRKVLFDNGISCLLYRTEEKQFDLWEGQALTEDAYEQLMALLVKRATKRAMHLLEQMDRTEKQLRDKLALGGYPSSCIEEAISYVKQYRYLDDYRYACHYICCAQERESRRKLAQKLMQKGISGIVIERALEENYCSDEDDKIQRLLLKRHFEPEQTDEKEFLRTYRFLLGKGFQSRDILAAMHAETSADTIYSGAF